MHSLARFCDIAMGSAGESEYQLLNSPLIEVKKMLNSFTRTVRKRL